MTYSFNALLSETAPYVVYKEKHYSPQLKSIVTAYLRKLLLLVFLYNRLKIQKSLPIDFKQDIRMFIDSWIHLLF